MQSDSSAPRRSLPVAIAMTAMALPLADAAAQVDLPPVSVGAGVRTSFTHVDVDDADAETSDFELNSARIYLSGKVTENINLMFNTEYTAGDEDIEVIDAVAQFSFSDAFNIWVGRFLPPSDRANLYGPYYASHWGVFLDGVQDGYPFETTGRADGLMYWGQFGIAKVSLGAFDIQDLTKDSSDVLYAGRVQLDFWNPEGGYYLNGTYYGEKDLLAIGLAGQNAAGENAYSLDFLFEKKLANTGVLTVEAEYAVYDGLGGYGTPLGGGYDKSEGYYVLAAYLFPAEVGIGKFQVLGKFGETTYEFDAGDLDQQTFELNVNYIMKSFNARAFLFYIDGSWEPDQGTEATLIGLGLQVQI